MQRSPLTALGAVLCTVALAACNHVITDASTSQPSPPTPALSRSAHIHIMPLIGHTLALPTAPPSGNGISYHGGPVIMAQRIAAIYWSSKTIYSGGPAPGSTGAGSADGSLIGYFLSHLGGSPYYNINTTYTNGAGTPISNSVTYTQFWAANDNVPLPLVPLTDAQMQAQIIEGFTSGKLTYDPNTLYAIFTDAMVNPGGAFGSVYCAYHGNFSWNGNDVKYAAMPHDIDFFDCNALSGSPNNDPAADAEVNTLAHETEETNTDEDLNAWYDDSGNENADKCAWTFGATYTTANGATANMKIGTKDFLV